MQRPTSRLAIFALPILMVGLSVAAEESSAVAEIQSLIEESYVHGAFNELNPQAMEKGFHGDFAIFSARGNELAKYPIGDWVARTAERKASSDFDPRKNVWSHRFVSVDVTGGAAAVKLELSKDGELVFTDYLSLLRFEDGWKIAAKVYHRHETRKEE